MLSGRYELAVMDDDDDDVNHTDNTTTDQSQPTQSRRPRLGYQHYRQLRVLPPTQVHTAHARMMHYGAEDGDGEDDAAAPLGTCP